jgi:hypothetical protein
MTEKSFFAGFGGAEESTRTGERVPRNNGDRACPPVNVFITKKAKGGRR